MGSFVVVVCLGGFGVVVFLKIGGGGCLLDFLLLLICWCVVNTEDTLKILY